MCLHLVCGLYSEDRTWRSDGLSGHIANSELVLHFLLPGSMGINIAERLQMTFKFAFTLDLVFYI